MGKITVGIFWVMVCFGGVASTVAQDLSLYQKEIFIMGGDTLPYRLLFPKNYEEKKTYPIVFFLHGRGESGTDNQRQLTHGSKMFLLDSIRDNYPAFVVFPQCPANNYWSNVPTILQNEPTLQRTFYFIKGGPPSQPMQLLTFLVDNILQRLPVNRQQVYVAGLSMGGMGTFELVYRKPNTFAAAVAICGGANPASAAVIKNTAWWLFHGLKDDVVPPAFSQTIALALKQAGAKVQLTLYPNANHNSWDPAFAEPDLFSWMFAQKRKTK